MENNREFAMPPDLRLKMPQRRYSGFWVGTLTVLVAAMVFFCELHLSAAPIEQTFVTGAVMLLCCFVMYTSLYDAGVQRAKEAPAFLDLNQSWEAVRETVRKRGDLRGLDRFATAYAEEELYEARSRYLLTFGLDMNQYQLWTMGKLPVTDLGEGASLKQKALKKAFSMKPMKLSAGALLDGGHGERRQLLLSSKEGRTKRLLFALGPTLVGCFMTVSVSLEGMELTLGAIALGLFRLFTIFWTGMRGYSAGAWSIEEEEKTVLSSRMTLLSAYLKETPTT